MRLEKHLRGEHPEKNTKCRKIGIEVINEMLLEKFRNCISKNLFYGQFSNFGTIH